MVILFKIVDSSDVLFFLVFFIIVIKLFILILKLIFDRVDCLLVIFYVNVLFFMEIVGRFVFSGGFKDNIFFLVRSSFWRCFREMFVLIVVVMRVGNMNRGNCKIVKRDKDVKVFVGVKMLLMYV